MRAIALQIAPSPVAGETRILHCACGATRQAPVGLAIVSCVRCGAAMGQTPSVRMPPPPSRILLALATLPTQLLGTFTFAIALVWIVAGVTDVTSIAVLIAGAACVFAGGIAHRGSVVALVACLVFDVAVALAMLVPLSEAIAFLAPLPHVTDKIIELARIIVGGIAVIAAAECLVAIPQARQFARWRTAMARRT